MVNPLPSSLNLAFNDELNARLGGGSDSFHNEFNAGGRKATFGEKLLIGVFLLTGIWLAVR